MSNTNPLPRSVSAVLSRLSTKATCRTTSRSMRRLQHVRHTSVPMFVSEYLRRLSLCSSEDRAHLRLSDHRRPSFHSSRHAWHRPLAQKHDLPRWVLPWRVEEFAASRYSSMFDQFILRYPAKLTRTHLAFTDEMLSSSRNGELVMRDMNKGGEGGGSKVCSFIPFFVTPKSFLSPACFLVIFGGYMLIFLPPWKTECHMKDHIHCIQELSVSSVVHYYWVTGRGH